MGTKGAPLAVAVLLAVAAASRAMPMAGGGDSEPSDGLQMGLPATFEGGEGGEVVADELVNGALAEDAPQLAPLRKGPKVNGGFALNVQPKTKKAQRVASNSDCAGGRVVDGRCMKPFPKPARKATEADNMASPEQRTDASYEPDIHRFVSQHFNQKVMEDTPADTHLTGFPSTQVISNEMNKGTNEDADEMSRFMMPVGSEMMQTGDAEVDVNVVQAMERVRSRPVYPSFSQFGSHGSSSKPEPESAGDVNEQAGGEQQSQQAPKESGDQTTSPKESGEQTTSPLMSGGDEVAEPGVPESPQVPEEMEDMEEEIPFDPVDQETELPPTPTPTPTPDAEAIAKNEAAKREFQEKLTSCVLMAEQNGYLCSDHSTAAVAAVPEAPFEPTNVAQNLQTMILACNKRTMLEFSQLSQSESATEATLTQERTTLADMFVRHANYMTCLNSPSFPSCLPAHVTTTLQQGPVEGDWPCA